MQEQLSSTDSHLVKLKALPHTLSLEVQNPNIKQKWRILVQICLAVCKPALSACVHAFQRFESAQAYGEVVCMVEEASPVWCTNSLVTRNHNVMEKKNNKPQPHSQNRGVQTNKSFSKIQKETIMWRSDGQECCYIMSV